MCELNHGWKPSMEEVFKTLNTDKNKMLDKYATRCGLLQQHAKSQLFTITMMSLQVTYHRISWPAE
jgi:hypothetical protein